jgi:hypothetical protein
LAVIVIRGRALFAGIVVVAMIGNSVVVSATGDAPQRELTHVRLVSTHGYSVDNDPNGQSGGDLFGSAGSLRKGGQRIGRFSSACALAPPVGGQCQATLIWRDRGQIQVAGNVRLTAAKNRLSIVGGTGQFRGVGGTARLEGFDGGTIQLVSLRILP